VEEIDICKIDEMVIIVFKQFFPNIVLGYDDPRVRLHIGDETSFLRKCQAAEAPKE
jgi:spermidine synthase